MQQLIPLPPDYENHQPARWEYGDYIIAIDMTIMGSFRVTASEKGKQWYVANWCAGAKGADVVKLVRYLLGALDGIEEQKIPIASRVKPYFNCQWFLGYLDGIEPHQVDVHFDARFARMMWEITIARQFELV